MKAGGWGDQPIGEGRQLRYSQREGLEADCLEISKLAVGVGFGLEAQGQDQGDGMDWYEQGCLWG